MEQEYAGKIVAITGAANGIGAATARLFAEAGANVVALDLNAEAVAAQAEKLQRAGYHCEGVPLDISDESAVQAHFAEIRQKYERLDVLVNSAGIISFDRFDQQGFDAWNRVMDINLCGTYACCRFAALIMRAQGSGAIVNISAGAAKTGGMNPSPAYVASKGGINSLTFHFAVQLAPHGVRVNAICPGPIDTQMMDAQMQLAGDGGNGKERMVASVPLGLGTAEDVAWGALFLASEVKARYITGEILDINGGLVMD